MSSTGEQDSVDSGLVARIMHGDRLAYSELFRRHRLLVRRVGLRVLRSSNEIDDFVQDVFLKVHLRLHTYSGSGGFRPWLKRIAFTTALNFKRRAAQPEPVDPTVFATSLTDNTLRTPLERMLRQNTLDAMRRAIQQLPEKYRRTMHLVYTRRLKYREVADLTNVPVGTVKSHVYRARKLLKSLLAGRALLPSVL